MKNTHAFVGPETRLVKHAHVNRERRKRQRWGKEVGKVGEG